MNPCHRAANVPVNGTGRPVGIGDAVPLAVRRARRRASVGVIALVGAVAETDLLPGAFEDVERRLEVFVHVARRREEDRDFLVRILRDVRLKRARRSIERVPVERGAAVVDAVPTDDDDGSRERARPLQRSRTSHSASAVLFRKMPSRDDPSRLHRTGAVGCGVGWRERVARSVSIPASLPLIRRNSEHAAPIAPPTNAATTATRDGTCFMAKEKLTGRRSQASALRRGLRDRR